MEYGKIQGPGFAQQSSDNLLRNGDFQYWRGGVSEVPSFWNVVGAGATVARESSIVRSGRYSAKVTRNGANVVLSNINNSDSAFYLNIRGKTLTFSAWVFATVAGTQLQISSTSGGVSSNFHPGDSTWRLLHCTHTTAITDTNISVNCRVLDTNTSSYFAEACLNVGFAPQASSKHNVDGGNRNVLQSAEINATTTIINLDSTMSAADIQQIIDDQPRFIPTAKLIKFLFADGTYTLTSALEFKGFTGPGRLRITGNESEGSLSLVKSVSLQSSGTAFSQMILFEQNSCNNIQCFNLELNCSTFVASTRGVHMSVNSGFMSIAGMSIIGNGTNLDLIQITNCRGGEVANNFVGSGNRGLYFTNVSSVKISNNDDDLAGTGQPLVGIRADASTIMKTGTQPAGSSVNEQTFFGAVIR